jgi:hypothetical protein
MIGEKRMQGFITGRGCNKIIVLDSGFLENISVFSSAFLYTSLSPYRTYHYFRNM